MGYIGHLLILLAGTGLGLYAAHRLQRQVVFLQQIDRLLQTLIRQLTYTARPMGELWRYLADTPLVGDLPLLADTVAGLESADFVTAFSAAVETAARDGRLTPEGRQLLLEMGQGCGRYDLSGQTEHLRHYRGRLEELRQELSRQAASKGQIYRVLGPAAGAALALLLM